MSTWKKIKKGRYEKYGFAIIEQPGGGVVLSRNARIVDFYRSFNDAKDAVKVFVKEEKKKNADVAEPAIEAAE